MKFYVKNEECPYCKPAQRSQLHLKEKIDKFFSFLGSFVPDFLENKFLWLAGRLEVLFVQFLVKLLNFFGLARFVNVREVEPGLIRNRSWVVIEECLRRGYDIELLLVLGFETEIFRFVDPEDSFLFYSLPLNKIGDLADIDFSNKISFRNFLDQFNYPSPEGFACKSLKEGLECAKGMSKPLVVKPANKSLSMHVFTGLSNKEEVEEAIKAVKQISYRYLIEEQVEGSVYRASLIEGGFVSCVRKEFPTVVGDGNSNIEELVETKNSSSRRKPSEVKNSTLHTVSLDELAVRCLSSQGFDLNDVPAEGREVVVYPKNTLSAGADIYGVTDKVSDEIKEMLEDLSSRLSAPILGVDFISKDITSKEPKDSIKILEANENPYIDMHHNTLNGKSCDVAKSLVDILERAD